MKIIILDNKTALSECDLIANTKYYIIIPDFIVNLVAENWIFTYTNVFFSDQQIQAGAFKQN